MFECEEWVLRARELPDSVLSETVLDDLLTTPSPALVAMLARLPGDIAVLGVGGKMGVTLGARVRRAIDVSGASKTVYGVSRFSDPERRDALEAVGIRTIPCDLLDRDAVTQLPQVENVIFMAGRKFGTQGAEAQTWATNVSVPDNVAYHYRRSRIVVFSTGCVYPLVSAIDGGCTESMAPDPVGEYAQSCLGRERVFSYWSHQWGTPICLMRLNYAIDLRYGVLHDIAARVFAGKPVDLTVSHFNAIWQGDANDWAVRCLDLCASPPAVINVTGPETVSVRFVAEVFARCFDTDVSFIGEAAGRHMYLSNAAQAIDRFGYPSVPLMRMIRWQADWIQRGGASLDKPTHFAVVDGAF
jgi:nucleoside-diphosphate-sugar epimerase